MANELIEAELLAACSALGYSDGAKYYRDPDCLETVKDLIKYLRRDDDSHEIRRALGETRVVQTDLIPILRDYSDEPELFDVTLRLMVNLTNPVLLLFREELPEEKVTRQQFLQLIRHQQMYKEKCADEKLWKVLVRKLEVVLQQSWNERDEDDKLTIERILILIRNILSVPANPQDEQRTDDDASLHDQVIWALHLAQFEVVLLYIASSDNESDLAMHALEVVSLMLREQDPTELAKADSNRSQMEKKKDEDALMKVLKKEQILKLEKMKKQVSQRHSRFGGTFYMKDYKGVSDCDLITHRPISDVKQIDFDKLKKSQKIPKNRQPLQCAETTRRSTLAIRMFLQEFCVEFLNGSYNNIMRIFKDTLNRGKSQEHDETYYFWAIKFFMAFNRSHQFKVELVTETLSVESFHYIQQQLEKYYESMSTDKKKIMLWSRRMHKALKAYQELLFTLSCMDKSEDSSLKECSNVLKAKLFYVIEYRELLLILLQNYDEIKMSKEYLKDLIETNHIYLKMLEQFCGKTRHLLVQNVGKPKRKSKKKQKAKQTAIVLTDEQLEEKWSLSSDELSSILQGGQDELPQTMPFDPLSDETDEQQMEKAMKQVNYLLRNNDLAEAVSLLRSSRELWPEGDVFGSQNMESAEEFIILRNIFMANINQPEISTTNDDEEHSESEDEYQESMPRVSEQELDLVSFVRRYANSKIMKTFTLLFARYETNSSFTNHCVLKMFHRIAWDAKLTAMFYQASIFCVFLEVFNNPLKRSDETLIQIRKFAKYIVKKFFETAKENSKAFFEILFWKNKNEAVEIECGYDTRPTGVVKGSWSEEEEDELNRLYLEFRENLLNEDEQNRDTVDYIMEAIINKDRSRQAIIKKLKELGLINDVKQLKRKIIKIKSTSWSEMEETELKVLFEEHKDANDPISMILLYMVEPKPKQRVIKKILELGLVNDRKELRKKRQPKSKKRDKTERNDDENTDNEENNTDDDVSEDDSSSDDGRVTKPNKVYNTPKPAKRKIESNDSLLPGVIFSRLQKVMDKNMKTSVEWIANELKDIANDREEDNDFEPIPIIPISGEDVDAMNEDSFLDLLSALGINSPQSHEEKFWRIPSNISIEGLRKRADFLLLGAEGNLPAQNETNDGSTIDDDVAKVSAESDSDDDLPLASFKGIKKPLASIDLNVPDVHNGNKNSENSQVIGHSKKKRGYSNHDSSEEEFKENVGKPKKVKNKNKRRKLIVEEDSDDDMESSKVGLSLNTEETNPFDQLLNESTSKRVVDSDSDDDASKIIKKRVVLDDSDSDDDASKNVKKGVVLDNSDSDDDASKNVKKGVVLDNSDSDDDASKNVKKGVVLDDSDSDDDASKNVKKGVVLDDSDSDDDASKNVKKGVVLDDSDSDDDASKNVKGVVLDDSDSDDDASKNVKKGVMLDDSDNDALKKRKKRVMLDNYDSEEDNHQPPKKSKVIDSDDD